MYDRLSAFTLGTATRRPSFRREGGSGLFINSHEAHEEHEDNSVGCLRGLSAQATSFVSFESFVRNVSEELTARCRVVPPQGFSGSRLFIRASSGDVGQAFSLSLWAQLIQPSATFSSAEEKEPRWCSRIRQTLALSYVDTQATTSMRRPGHGSFRRYYCRSDRSLNPCVELRPQTG